MSCQDATSDAAGGNSSGGPGGCSDPQSETPAGERGKSDGDGDGVGLSFRVLLLDDDPNYAGPVVELMERDRFHVDWCRTAEEAVEVFREGRHAVVLLELNLAGTPGDECAQELRAIDPTVDIIAVTTQATECGWRKRAEAVGIRTVLHMHKTSAGYGDRIRNLLTQASERYRKQA